MAFVLATVFWPDGTPLLPTHLKESVLDLHVEELVLSDVLGHRLRHVLPAAEGVGEAAVDGLRREGQAVAALLQGMLNGQNLK